MEKKQPITVRVNQDEPRKVQNVSQADTDELKYPLVVEVPEHPKDLDSSKNNLSKKQLPPVFKVFLFAGAPALVIGILFGFIMLHLFSGIETDPPNNQHAPVAGGQSFESSLDKTSGNGKQNKGEVGKFMLPGISAFVLQSGIFSEKTNAEQAKNELKSSGFPALVSEKDGQYFLLAGIAASDKEAKKIAGQMKKSKLDVYAKEWPIAEKEIHMEKKEYEWIVGIQKKLQSTLTSMSENGNINSSVWEGTDEQQPANSNKLKGIRADVSAMAKLGTEATEENKQQLLLQIFQDYESISGD